jgi:hypothetical protein
MELGKSDIDGFNDGCLLGEADNVGQSDNEGCWDGSPVGMLDTDGFIDGVILSREEGCDDGQGDIDC